jgi:hypothetical protein
MKEKTMQNAAQVNQKYRVECHDRRGRLKWVEEFDNLVVTAGRNKYLDATLKTGLASPAWYVGLKGTGTVDPADTMGSHPGWSQITPYSNSTRPAWTPGSISGGSVDNSGSKAVFNINTGTTVYGAFIADDNTKGGAIGTLLGAGDFSSPRAVENGDTLSVTVTCSISAS